MASTPRTMTRLDVLLPLWHASWEAILVMKHAKIAACLRAGLRP
jgi:hypothetical protein